MCESQCESFCIRVLLVTQDLGHGRTPPLLFFFLPFFSSCLQTPVQWSLASTMGGWGTQWGSTSNRGNRQEQSDGQQQGQNDGEHRREKSKREHDGEIGTAVDGGGGGGGSDGLCGHTIGSTDAVDRLGGDFFSGMTGDIFGVFVGYTDGNMCDSWN